MDKSLKSMKMSVKEMKADAPGIQTGAEKGPTYPYGLEIRLDDATMTKLGLSKESFSSGESVTISAKAKVTSIEERSFTDEGGKSKTRKSMTCQITDMSVTSAA